MVYQLYLSDKKSLLDKPETGMGYQVVEAKNVGSSQKRKFVVYNSEVAIDLDDYFLENKTKLFSNRVIKHIVRGFQKFDAINDLSLLPIETNSIVVLNKKQAPVLRTFSAYEKVKNKRHSGTVGATDGRLEFANG